jgi:hypothetical protein
MVAFWVVFGLFVSALGLWAIKTARWAIRQDRERRSQAGDSLKG